MMPHKGDPCPTVGCKGSLIVRGSRRVSETIEQRLECNKCRRNCGMDYVPAERVTVWRPKRV